MPSAARCAVLLIVASTAACGGSPADAPAASAQTAGPQTEEEKTLYALGLAVGRNLASFSLTTEELKMVELGLEDAVSGRDPRIDFQAYSPKVQELAQAIIQKESDILSTLELQLVGSG